MSGDTPGHEQKAWPGVWTNSVCGHPQEGETIEQAMVRRCRYEVGQILSTLRRCAGFRYRETDPSGIVENEICPVLPHKSYAMSSTMMKSWNISG
jgi:isopentenyldiphosphate isomerase